MNVVADKKVKRHGDAQTNDLPASEFDKISMHFIYHMKRYSIKRWSNT